MNKKLILVIYFFLLPFTISARAQVSGQLDTNTYWDRSFKMGNYDRYVWSFTSSTSEIIVLALTAEEYDAFYNIYLSDYSAILNRNDEFEDSGTWRPHKQSTWHILYINRGDSTTYLSIDDQVDKLHYFPMIPLIIGLCIGIPSIAGITLYLYRRKKKQKGIKNTKP